MEYSPPGSSVHGILQARILEWVATSFSRRFSWPRGRTGVSYIAGRFFTIWATREALQMRSTLKLFKSHGHWGDSESRGGLWDRAALGIQTWIPGQSIAGPSPAFLAITPLPAMTHVPTFLEIAQWGLIWPQDWDKWMNDLELIFTLILKNCVLLQHNSWLLQSMVGSLRVDSSSSNDPVFIQALYLSVQNLDL